MNISLSKGIARQEVHKILFSCVALAYLITFIQKEYFVWRKSIQLIIFTHLKAKVFIEGSM